MLIAVVLFMVSDMFRILPDRLSFSLDTCKDLIPMVGLNVIGLRYCLMHRGYARGVDQLP